MVRRRDAASAMNIVTPSFRLELSPSEPVGEGGWARVRVRVGVCGFRGDFDARIQLDDLRRFDRELEALEMEATPDARAVLTCDEAGLDVRLQAQAAGLLSGRFALESERAGGAWTTLSGTFELDQALVPDIRASLRALVGALAA
jgi:hypothetical protein